MRLEGVLFRLETVRLMHLVKHVKVEALGKN
jgi:hypothetical protein